MTYNKAERKPRVCLDDLTAPVAAVVALARYALVALDLLAERVLAAREDETHGDRRLWLSTVYLPLLLYFVS